MRLYWETGDAVRCFADGDGVFDEASNLVCITVPSSVGTSENPGGRLYVIARFSTFSSRIALSVRLMFLWTSRFRM